VDPFDVVDACRVAVFTDPEGAAFRVWQAKEHKGARIVNEPGSLNFNGLNTRDAEAAKSFYGSSRRLHQQPPRVRSRSMPS
jgi:predicted enzyme related to lactoylglutathione lyase